MGDLQFKKIAVSGKVAVGTTTLAKNLVEALAWEYINVGKIQRAYHDKVGLITAKHGSITNTDEHELEMEAMTKNILNERNNIIYEAWLAGFIAQKIPHTLRVLVVCSNFGIRVDRVSNRDNLSMKEAKHFIMKREHENIAKWKKLYGDHDFWDPKYFHLVIDTAKSGPMETLGIVLDRLGYNRKV